MFVLFLLFEIVVVKSYAKYPLFNVSQHIKQIDISHTNELMSTNIIREANSNRMKCLQQHNAIISPQHGESPDAVYYHFIWNEIEINSFNDSNMYQDWIYVYDIDDQVDDVLAHQHLHQNRMNRMFVLTESIILEHKPHMFDIIYGYYHLKGHLYDHLYNSDILIDFYDSFFDIQQYEYRHMRVAIQYDSFINNYGLILNPTTCSFLRNGGCTYMHHGKIYRYDFAITKYYDKVISITSGASATWHFPGEALVALANIDKNLLHESFIHIPEMKSYSIEWLELLGISKNKIISDNVVFARNILIPEMGRCGFPYHKQIIWLANEFTKDLLPKNVTTTIQSTYENYKPLRLLFIHRSRTRVITNAHEVKSYLQSYVKQHGYELDIHSDENGYPTLKEQVRRFYNADIIIASHGAGEVFITFSSSSSCLIDFVRINEPLCYSRLAYLKGMSYISYLCQNFAIDINQLKEGLEKCVQAHHIAIKTTNHS